MMEHGVYLYGFIKGNQEQRFGPIGIEGADVYAIPFRDTGAVVSNLPYIAFDTLPKKDLLAYLTVHQSALEAVLRDQQIIPVKFGTVLEAKESIFAILEQGYERISTSIHEMENRVELDIVALWPDTAPLLAEIAETEEIQALKENAAADSEDAQFALRIKVGKRVKDLLDERREACSHEIMDAVLPFAEAHRIHSLMDDSMIMNMAILIEKDQIDLLEAGIEKLDRGYEDQINFRIIGPVPPYSFQTLEIKRMDPFLLDKARKALDLGKESSIRNIRDAYWTLTKKYHPDRFPGDAAAQKRFEELNAAYKLVNEFCDGRMCSFRENDVRNWMRVRPVEV